MAVSDAEHKRKTVVGTEDRRHRQALRKRTGRGRERDGRGPGGEGGGVEKVDAVVVLDKNELGGGRLFNPPCSDFQSQSIPSGGRCLG